LATNNEIFKEDLTEIKYLQEKVELLRQEEKADEALTLERRVKRKVKPSPHLILFLYLYL
jgi:hypothetical protein